MEHSDLNRERDAALARAMDALWQRFLPDIRGRVDLLAAAARSAAAGALSEDVRAAAQAAAHKLAGTLGTFGLTRGTVMARELEIRLGGDGVGPDEARELMRTAADLRAIVDNRN